MKRLTIVALVAGALTVTLTGCGSDTSSTADHVHQSTTAAAATGTSAAPAVSTPPVVVAATPVQPPAEAPSTSAAATKKATAPAGAQTTCGEFHDLTEEAQKQVVDQVLAANPGSSLEGSPNAALSTAKLACSAASYANSTVAVAIGVAK